MKPKTLQKILRRFDVLPLHHIDTDIFIESDKETKLGDICASYLNKVGYKYRGTVSLSVLGEFLLITLRDTEKPEDKELAIRIFDRMIRKRKIRFVTPATEAYETAVKVIKLDSRIENTDALHYAIAVQEKSNAFVTFDGKMVGNKILEKEFGVKIIPPENL